MLIYICIAILALYLISVPIRVKVKGGLKTPDGRAEVALSVFHVPVLKADGLWRADDFGEGDLIPFRKKKKTTMHVNMKQSPAQTLRNIKKVDLSIIGNLDVKTVRLKMHYGNDNAFLTMAALSGARILFYSAMSALKSNQQVDIKEEFVPLYNKKELKLEFSGIFSLSVADIIYGYTVGKLRKLSQRLSVGIKPKRRKRLPVPPKEFA